MSTDEIVSEMTNQGVTAAHRITRMGEDGKRVNTPTLILTVRGTTVPEFLKFGFLRTKPRLYYPPPMQCFNCWEFGHTKARCNKDKICYNCSASHPADSPEATQCTIPPACKNCKGAHRPGNRSCPLYLKEKRITDLKTKEGISFPAARRQIEEQDRLPTYSSQVSNRTQPTTNANSVNERMEKARNNDDIIMRMSREIVELKKIIAYLRNQQDEANEKMDVATGLSMAARPNAVAVQSETTKQNATNGPPTAIRKPLSRKAKAKLSRELASENMDTDSPRPANRMNEMTPKRKNSPPTYSKAKKSMEVDSSYNPHDMEFSDTPDFSTSDPQTSLTPIFDEL